MATTSFKPKIGIIGLGMVGEPIRRWFEEEQGYVRGVDLFLYDTDHIKKCTDDINCASIIFVAVPTPSNPKDGSCNTSIVEDVITNKIADGKIVVIKSTILPGTTYKIQMKNPHKIIIFNPEFLTEGQSWADYIHPVRQIVSHTDKSREYTMMVKNLLPEAVWSVPSATDYDPLLELNTTEAEIVKYASNIFGAIKVTFANIMFDMCQFVSRAIGVKVDWEKIRSALAADPRIGPAWLDVQHGKYRGFGGYCFPKDFMAMIFFLKKNCYFDVYQKDIGVDVLVSIWKYNKLLLHGQGFSVEEVSSHDKDLNEKLARIKHDK
jgi:nucleotide sugar dehydrogenase